MADIKQIEDWVQNRYSQNSTGGYTMTFSKEECASMINDYIKDFYETVDKVANGMRYFIVFYAYNMGYSGFLRLKCNTITPISKLAFDKEIRGLHQNAEITGLIEVTEVDYNDWIK